MPERAPIGATGSIKGEPRVDDEFLSKLRLEGGVLVRPDDTGEV